MSLWVKLWDAATTAELSAAKCHRDSELELVTFYEGRSSAFREALTWVERFACPSPESAVRDQGGGE